MSDYALAVDIGGTFTDAVLTDADGTLTVAKVLTTPHDPVDGFVYGVEQVLAAAAVAPSQVSRVVHATTLATNVILERRGVNVALVTTKGYRSILALGRNARVEEDRYALHAPAPQPPVPLTHTFEVDERIDARGTVLTPLDLDEADAVIAAVRGLGVAAVAICFINSYANGAHEHAFAARCRAALGEGVEVVTSVETLPEMREFERLSTTVMSAYVGPVMGRYLQSVHERLGALGVHAPVHVMESSGGVMPARIAATHAVNTIESGPAAGVIAAQYVGQRSGLTEVISFDMGGTTAKAGVIRKGKPHITNEFIVGGKGSMGGRRSGSGTPIKIPAIDLAEVGSGGGSIAWVDAGGSLRVGPHSAGADPGPACYQLGGTAPTVTDANLVLGYLDAARFAGGTMALSTDAAVHAITTQIAQPLGLGLHEAAFAIHQLANANMGAAIHVVTVQRGIDPREFALVASGGAGPTHVCSLVERFDIRRVLIPPHSGVGSALGLLATDLVVQRSRTQIFDLATVRRADIEPIFDQLERTAIDQLGTTRDAVTIERTVAMRYLGQAHEISIEIADRDELQTDLAARFNERYRQLFGFSVNSPMQLVSYRAMVTLAVPRAFAAHRRVAAPPGATTTRPAYFPSLGGTFATPVYARGALHGTLAGPLLIDENETTIVVPPGWSAECDDHDNVWLTR